MDLPFVSTRVGSRGPSPKLPPNVEDELLTLHLEKRLSPTAAAKHFKTTKATIYSAIERAKKRRAINNEAPAIGEPTEGHMTAGESTTSTT